MSVEAVRAILETKLNTDWAGRTPIAWDNVEYSAVPGNGFIRCSIQGVSSEAISRTCKKEEYRFVVEVHSATDTEGLGAHFQLVDSIAAIFHAYQEGNSSVGSIVYDRVGKYDGWFRSDVLIDVVYYQHF